MNLPQTSSRIVWIDNLKSLATMAVVFLHVASTALYEYGKIPAQHWWAAHIYDSLVRWCVPVFLMVTGALLIPHPEPSGKFYPRRIGKIVVPFFIWSLIYIVVSLFHAEQQGVQLSGEAVLRLFAHKLYHGASYHLWYVYMLLGIYIVFLFAGTFIQKLSDGIFIVIFILWSLLLTLPYVPQFNTLPKIPHIQAFLGYVGYTLLGDYLSRKTFSNMVAVCCMLLGFAITVLGTYIYSQQSNAFVDIYYKYTTLHIAWMAAGVFIWVKNITRQGHHTWIKIREVIAPHSLGIYLIHVLVLDVLNSYHIDWYLWNPMVGIPFTSLWCISISTAIVYYSKKYRIGKVLFG